MSARDVKRAANEILRRTCGVAGVPLPYYCECDDPDCLRAVWLDAAEYDRRRPLGPIGSETPAAAA